MDYKMMLVVFLLLGGSTWACRTALSKSSSDIKQYDLKGRVEFVDQKNGGVTVAHEDIPGFMPAMTMLFKVKDKASLSGVKLGDQIKAVVVYDRQTKETWLQHIVVVEKAAQR
jgi:protein SCO1/2